MSGELAPKHRLVLCPKCWKLLPESPDYNVYKCGGCGTTLQAKKRKSVAVNSESSTHEKDAAPRNTLDRVSEDKQYNNGEQLVIPEDNGLREKAASSSSGECSLEGNVGRDHIENGECNGQQHGPFNLSDEEREDEKVIYKLSDIRRHKAPNKGSLNELTYSGIEASSGLMGGNSVEDANDRDLQLAEADELSNGNISLEVAAEELICVLDEDDANNGKSTLVGLKSEMDITRSDSEGAEELNNRNLFSEGAEEELISGPDGEDANNEKSAMVGPNPEVDKAGSPIAEAEEVNSGNLLLEGAEEELNTRASDGEDPNNDQSDLVGAQSEVDTAGNASSAKRSSTENFISEKGSILQVASCKLEEGTSGNHVSSPNQQQKQVQKNNRHSFDSVKSMDTFDTTEVINPSSELSGTRELSKPPTTRSSHAYDGSICSYDGMDEWFPISYLDSFEKTCAVANGVSEGRLRKEKGLVSSMLHRDLETQHPSYLPNGRHNKMKDSRVNENKMLETTAHGHRHWMRTKKDEFPYKMHFHRSGPQSGYESGSPSNQTHDELYCCSSFLLPDSCEDPEQEKMKLLRMIYRLQDQLNRTGSVNGETNGRLFTGVPYEGNCIPACQSHDLHEGRFYLGLDYPRCNGGCSNGINWGQRHKFSGIPYLGEATSSRHHVDHSCFQCCDSQEWQCSAVLPPHVLFQREELCKCNLGQKCYSSHCSYPSSSQWFMASKQSLTKRHFRPLAGGAPFVTCRNCLKLLQLPADFLLFKRVCHQLKCGACSEVLKFSLQNKSHIVSYAPKVIGATPSSKLNEQKEVINGSNLDSASHDNCHSSHAEPVSYSDDCGLSVHKSYSSEGDPVSLTPFHPLHGSEYDDNPSDSCGIFEPIPEKKLASRRSSASKTPVETDESAGLSSNVSGSEKLSSEMETRSLPKSSPLHQLMGYSSPIQMIRGIQPSVESKELILKGENYPES